MYRIKNGILEKEGKKLLAIGQSYYPSFHEAKYPVPPNGDRVGEMKKDFRLMKKMGFNHIRMASVGVCKLNEKNELVLDTPFVDEMIKEAEKLDISVSVRIEGYSVNLRDFKNVLMIDAKGKVQNTKRWQDFIQTTLAHDGISEDNILYAETKAKHYDKSKNVVAYQIFNEPHFPGPEYFDYHPKNIEKYRKYLVDKKIMTKEQAQVYKVPKSRTDDTPEMWAYWRLYNRDMLTSFLNNAASGVKNVSKNATFTCYTADALGSKSSYKGVDPFGNARYMDIVGYTNYCHCTGTEYYPTCLLMDNFVHAAQCENKTSWCIEVDSRTTIPPSLFVKNTIATVGSGAKGLVYYQWRGDYPSEATPIPNGCGLVNFDGSKTQNYDNAKKTVKLLNMLSDCLVNTEPANERIGIFYSDYANFVCDARQNGNLGQGEDLTNNYIEEITEIYTELRLAGFNPKTVDETALKENKYGIDLLFVPTKYALSKSELEAIREFMKKGKVYETHKHFRGMGGFGYLKFDAVKDFVAARRTYENTMQTMNDVVSDREFSAKTLSPDIAVQTLVGKNYKVLCVVNLTHPTKEKDCEIECGFDIESAEMFEVGKRSRKLKVKGRKITVKNIADGGFIIVR